LCEICFKRNWSKNGDIERDLRLRSEKNVKNICFSSVSSFLSCFLFFMWIANNLAIPLLKRVRNSDVACQENFRKRSFWQKTVNHQTTQFFEHLRLFNIFKVEKTKINTYPVKTLRSTGYVSYWFVGTVNFSGPNSQHIFPKILGTFKIENLAASNCVKDWGKVDPNSQDVLG